MQVGLRALLSAPLRGGKLAFPQCPTGCLPICCYSVTKAPFSTSALQVVLSPTLSPSDSSKGSIIWFFRHLELVLALKEKRYFPFPSLNYCGCSDVFTHPRIEIKEGNYFPLFIVISHLFVCCVRVPVDSLRESILLFRQESNSDGQPGGRILYLLGCPAGPLPEFQAVSFSPLLFS